MPRKLNSTSFKKGQKFFANGKPMGRPKGIVPWNKGIRQWPNGLPESMKINISKALKGNPNTGRKNKKRIEAKCKLCNRIFTDISYKIKTGRQYCSHSCANMDMHKPGGNSYAYFHRISRRIASLYYNITKCTKCLKTGIMDIHHIDNNQANNNPDNLQVLCHSCHVRLTRYNECLSGTRIVKRH